MDSHESRAGDSTTHGPLQLKSIWISHPLRNFDLMVIMQTSGGEEIAQRVISGKEVSASEVEVLEIANELAQQKGYLPLFNVSGNSAAVTDGANEELASFFKSEDWLKRDKRGTRQL